MHTKFIIFKTPIQFTMTKYYFIILLMSCSSLVTAQSTASKEEEIVKQLIKDVFQDVWSDFDSEKIKKYHTDDFLLLEDGMVWNNDSIMSYQQKQLKANKRVIRKNDFSFVRTEKLDNAVWVAYQNYATWTSDGKTVGNAHWLESAVAIKTKEGWKLQMLHSTRVPNE